MKEEVLQNYEESTNNTEIPEENPEKYKIYLKEKQLSLITQRHQKDSNQYLKDSKTLDDKIIELQKLLAIQKEL